MTMRGVGRKIKVPAVLATVLAISLGTSIALLWRNSDRDETAAREAIEHSALVVPMPPTTGGLRQTYQRQRAAHPLWRVVDEGSVQAVPPYAESWSEAGRVLVDVTATSQWAQAWRVGDRLAVDVPQLGGGFREWTVERIDDGHDGRSRSVRGWIDGDGQRRRMVVTVGPGRVLAYLDTPQGPYELTGNARLAWLLPSSSMMAGIDFSQPDYILPARQGRDNEDK